MSDTHAVKVGQTYRMTTGSIVRIESVETVTTVGYSFVRDGVVTGQVYSRNLENISQWELESEPWFEEGHTYSYKGSSPLLQIVKVGEREGGIRYAAGLYKDYSGTVVSEAWDKFEDYEEVT